MVHLNQLSEMTTDDSRPNPSVAEEPTSTTTERLAKQVGCEIKGNIRSIPDHSLKQGDMSESQKTIQKLYQLFKKITVENKDHVTSCYVKYWVKGSDIPLFTLIDSGCEQSLLSRDYDFRHYWNRADGM